MEHPAQGFTIGGVTEGGHHIVGAGRQGHFGQGGAEIFQGDEVIGSGNGGADLILTSGIQQGGGKARQPAARRRAKPTWPPRSITSWGRVLRQLSIKTVSEPPQAFPSAESGESNS